MYESEIPWERKPSEPKLWFSRFERYYLPLGEERTYEACFRLWRADNPNGAYIRATLSPIKQKRPSQVWYRIASQWKWQDRAEAWDKEQRRLRIAAEDAEAKEWQEKRRQLMTGFFAKVAAALNRLNLDQPNAAPPTIAQLTQAVKLVLDQNRLEYGLPTEISQVQQVYDVEWRETNEN